jgi:carboxy-cis,cis-muconate cyclase
MQGNCTGKDSAFVLQSSSSPHAVYTAQWPGPDSCGMATSVLRNGTLSDVIQTWKYGTKSGVHGLSLGAAATNLYSADLSGDGVWTHSVDSDGKVSEVSTYHMPRTGMHPRHLAAHPSGSYLYVVMEAGNSLVVCSLDGETGAPNNETASYSLIPEGSLT